MSFAILLAAALLIAAPTTTRAHGERSNGEYREPQRIESIEIRGLDKTDRHTVLREFELREGDELRRRALSRTRTRLLRTGYFHEVRFSIEKGTQPGWVRLLLEVRERNTVVFGQARYGGRAAYQLFARRGFTAGGIGISDINWLGTGQTLSFNAHTARRSQYLLGLNWLEPQIGGTRWMAEGEFTYQRREDYFSEDLTAGPARSFGDLLQLVSHSAGWLVGLGYKGRDQEVWAETLIQTLDIRYAGGNRQDYLQRVKERYSLNHALALVWKLDTRNRVDLPRRGWRAQLRYETSLTPVSGDYGYGRTTLEARGYRGLGEGSVSLGLEGGYVDRVDPYMIGFSIVDLMATDGVDEPAGIREGLDDRLRLLTQGFDRAYGGIEADYTVPIYLQNEAFLRRIRARVFAGVYDTWQGRGDFLEELLVPLGLELMFDTEYGVVHFRFGANVAVHGSSMNELTEF